MSANLVECQFRCFNGNEIICVSLKQLTFEAAQETAYDDYGIFVSFQCNGCGQKHQVRLAPDEETNG